MNNLSGRMFTVHGHPRTLFHESLNMSTKVPCILHEGLMAISRARSVREGHGGPQDTLLLLQCCQVTQSNKRALIPEIGSSNGTRTRTLTKTPRGSERENEHHKSFHPSDPRLTDNRRTEGGGEAGCFYDVFWRLSRTTEYPPLRQHTAFLSTERHGMISVPAQRVFPLGFSRWQHYHPQTKCFNCYSLGIRSVAVSVM